MWNKALAIIAAIGAFFALWFRGAEQKAKAQAAEDRAEAAEATAEASIKTDRARDEVQQRNQQETRHEQENLDHGKRDYFTRH